MDNRIVEKISLFKDALLDLTPNNKLLNLDNYEEYEVGLNEIFDSSRLRLPVSDKINDTSVLCIGQVSWNNIVDNTVTFRAPVFCIPLNNHDSSYDIEDLEFNSFLKYKLETYDIIIPLFDSPDILENDVKDYMDLLNNLLGSTDFNFSYNCFMSNTDLTNLCVFNELSRIDYNSTGFYGFNRLLDNQAVDKSSSLKSVDDYSVCNSSLNLSNCLNHDNSILINYSNRSDLDYLLCNIISQLTAADKSVLVIDDNNGLDSLKEVMYKNGIDSLLLDTRDLDNIPFSILKTINMDEYEVTDYSLYTELDRINDKIADYDKALKNFKDDTNHTYDEYKSMQKSLEQQLNENNQEIIDVRINNLYKLDEERFTLIKDNLENVVKSYKDVEPIKKHKISNLDEAEIRTLNIGYIRQLLSSIEENYSKLQKEIKKLEKTTQTNNKNLTLRDTINRYKLVTPNVIKYYNYKKDIKELTQDLIIFKELSENINITYLDVELDEDIELLETYIYIREHMNINPLILEQEDVVKTLNKLKKYNNEITTSRVQHLVNDEQLQEKLKIYKKRSKIPGIQYFNEKYRKINREFTKNYPDNMPQKIIIRDIEQLLKNRQILQDTKNQILPYYTQQQPTDTYEIIADLEELITNENKIQEIIKKTEHILGPVKKNTTLTDIIKRIHQRDYLKEIIKKIDKKDKFGRKILGTKWKTHDTNPEDLQEIIEEIDKYDKEFKNTKIIKQDLEQYQETLNTTQQLYLKLEQDEKQLNIQLNNREWLNTIKTNREFTTATDKIDRQLNNLIRQKLFYTYIKDNTNKYTEKLLENIKQDKIKSENITDIYTYNYITSTITKEEKTNPTLKKYTKQEYTRLEKEKQEIQNKTHELNKIRIKQVQTNNKNINKIKTENPKEYNKLENILAENKINKKQLSQIKNIITKIKPCHLIEERQITDKLPLEEYNSYYDYIILNTANKQTQIPAILRTKNIIQTTKNNQNTIKQLQNNTYTLKKTTQNNTKPDIKDKYKTTTPTKYTPARHPHKTSNKTTILEQYKQKQEQQKNEIKTITQEITKQQDIIQEKRTTKQKLEEEQEKLEEKLEQLQQKNNTIKQEQEKLKNQIHKQEQEDKLKQKENQLKEYEQEITTKYQENKEYYDKLQEEKQQLEENIEKYNKNNEELIQKQDLLKKQETQLDNKQKQYSQDQKEYKEKQEQLQQKQETLNKQTQQLEKQKQQHQQTKKETEEYLNNIYKQNQTRINKQQKKLEKEQKQQQTQINDKQKQLEEKETQINDEKRQLEENIQEYNKNNEELTQKQTQINDKKRQLEEDIQEYNKNNEELTQKQETLNKQTQQLEKQIQQHQQTKKETEEYLNNIYKQNQTRINKQQEKLEKEQKQQQIQINDKQKQLEEKETQINDKNRQLEENIQEYNKNNEKLTQKQNLLNIKEDELLHQQQLNEQEKTQLNEDKKDLEEKKSELKEIQQKYDEANAEINEQMEHIIQFSTDLKVTEEIINNRQVELKKLEQEIQDKKITLNKEEKIYLDNKTQLDKSIQKFNSEREKYEEKIKHDKDNLQNEKITKNDVIRIKKEFKSLDKNIHVKTIKDDTYFYLNNEKIMKIDELPETLIIDLYIDQKFFDNVQIPVSSKQNNEKTTLHLKNKSDVKKAKRVIVNVYSNFKEIKRINATSNIDTTSKQNNKHPKTYVNYKFRSKENTSLNTDSIHKSEPKRTNTITIPVNKKNKESHSDSGISTNRDALGIKGKLHHYSKFNPNKPSEYDNLPFSKDEVDVARRLSNQDNNVLCQKYFDRYEEYQLSDIMNKQLSREGQKNSIEYLKSIIKKVIDKEYPIHGALLYYRVKEIFKPKKSLEFNQNFLNSLEKLENNGSVYHQDKFYFPKNYNIANLRPRTHENADIDFIFDDELLLSLICTFKNDESLSGEKLINQSIENMGLELNNASKDKYMDLYNSLK